MVILPNRVHDCPDDPHFVRTQRDDVVKHLRDREPPDIGSGVPTNDQVRGRLIQTSMGGGEHHGR
jgi:hypothetical protein